MLPYLEGSIFLLLPPEGKFEPLSMEYEEVLYSLTTPVLLLACHELPFLCPCTCSS